MRRRTEITVETDRLVIVRRRGKKSIRDWCATCDMESLMLTVDEAAMLLSTSSMKVFRLADIGQLHWVETQTGSLLICQNSLLQNQRTLPDSPD